MTSRFQLDPIGFGAAFYPEYFGMRTLEEDLELLTALSASMVKMGDASWAALEPRDGFFDFDWLSVALDELHKRSLRVLLCTPTYAMPAWLAQKDPEIFALHRDGRRRQFGGRQNMDITHPLYRFHAERIIRALMERFAAHPAVVGVQLDNETGIAALHNKRVIEQFKKRVEARFGTPDQLNEAWGLTYWSHRLSDWSELWNPDGNTSPSYDLEWRRFQLQLTAEFISWQAEICREYLPTDKFLTTNMLGGHGRWASDRHELGASLDIAAENLYHPTRNDLSLEQRAEEDVLRIPEQWLELGVASVYDLRPWSLWLKADLGRAAIPGQNFLATELNATSITDSGLNYPSFPGQWRLVVYTYIARGASALLYWNWRMLPYGAEMYWGGIVGHDGAPNRCYRELAGVGKELKAASKHLEELRPHPKAALLYSTDSRMALTFQPCLHNDVVGDKWSYERIFDAFYRGLFDARIDADIVYPDHPDLPGFPLLVVPALYVASDELLDRLLRYAEDGGHLVVTFRFGYADSEARARSGPKPTAIHEALGASYQLYSNLEAPEPVRVNSVFDDLVIDSESSATSWMDELVTSTGQSLISYSNHALSDYSAVVTNKVGHGRITYIGTLPTRNLTRSLMLWAGARAGLEVSGAELPPAVRIMRAKNRSDEWLSFVSNWSDKPLTVRSPASGQELLTQEAVDAGEDLLLEPWSIIAIVEDAGEALAG